MSNPGKLDLAGLAVALLDRLTHHVHILEMNGESYRLKRSRENATSQASEEPTEVQLSPGSLPLSPQCLPPQPSEGHSF